MSDGEKGMKEATAKCRGKVWFLGCIHSGIYSVKVRLSATKVCRTGDSMCRNDWGGSGIQIGG